MAPSPRPSDGADVVLPGRAQTAERARGGSSAPRQRIAAQARGKGTRRGSGHDAGATTQGRRWGNRPRGGCRKAALLAALARTGFARARMVAGTSAKRGPRPADGSYAADAPTPETLGAVGAGATERRECLIITIMRNREMHRRGAAMAVTGRGRTPPDGLGRAEKVPAAAFKRAQTPRKIFASHPSPIFGS
jgi:hypothetical protein